MQAVDVYIDPSCPWAWVTSRWLEEVAPARDLELRWRSYCLEIRDEGKLPPSMPEQIRAVAPQLRRAAHRVLRVFERLRSDGGEDRIGPVYTEWGQRLFGTGMLPDPPDATLLPECLQACALDPGLDEAGDDPKWDAPIRASMEAAYAVAGAKSQTPVVVLGGERRRGFKGPVMAPAPTGEAALRLWDAFCFLADQPGVFELTRPRQLPFLGR